jgi:hypothetical protein
MSFLFPKKIKKQIKECIDIVPPKKEEAYFKNYLK